MTKKTNNLSASLRQKIQNIIHQEDGFSFIEVIIVIAMILILSAILIPSYFGFVESAREANVKISAQNMYTAVQMANLSLEDISTSEDLFDELQRLNPALVGIGAVFDVSKTSNENDKDDYLEVLKLTENDSTEVSPLLIAEVYDNCCAIGEITLGENNGFSFTYYQYMNKKLYVAIFDNGALGKVEVYNVYFPESESSNDFEDNWE